MQKHILSFAENRGRKNAHFRQTADRQRISPAKALVTYTFSSKKFGLKNKDSFRSPTDLSLHRPYLLHKSLHHFPAGIPCAWRWKEKGEASTSIDDAGSSPEMLTEILRQVEKVNKGDTIRIIRMNDYGGKDLQARMYNGRSGLVDYIDSLGQLHGTWGGLALIPEVDDFEIVETLWLVSKSLIEYNG